MTKPVLWKSVAAAVGYLLATGCVFTDLTEARLDNDPPVISAEVPEWVLPGARIELRGLVRDPESRLEQFGWRQVEPSPDVVPLLLDPDTVTELPSGARQVDQNVTAPAAPGALSFELFAIDSHRNEVRLSVAVVVNAAPQAIAGDDQAVSANERVQLDGSGTDTPGATLSYRWSQRGGDAVVLSDPASAKPTFTAPATTQSLAFELTVTDELGAASAPSTVNVAVNAGPIPEFSFPREGSLVGLRSTIRVEGTVVEPDGERVDIIVRSPTEERVLENRASGPWATPLAIPEGPAVPIEVEVVDRPASGKAQVATATIAFSNEYIARVPYGLAVQPSTGRLLTVDTSGLRRLPIVFDPASGARTIVVPPVPNDQPLAQRNPLFIDDEGGCLIFPGFTQLATFDLATGRQGLLEVPFTLGNLALTNRSGPRLAFAVVTDVGVQTFQLERQANCTYTVVRGFSGPLSGTQGVGGWVVAGDDELYIVDPGRNEVLRRSAEGRVSVLSAVSAGVPMPTALRSITLDLARERLLVTGGTFDIRHVSVALSANQLGQRRELTFRYADGAPADSVTAFAPNPGTDALWALTANGIGRTSGEVIDLGTRWTRGRGGIAFASTLLGLALEASTDRPPRKMLVASGSSRDFPLREVDLNTGDRRVVSSDAVGDGPGFTQGVVYDVAVNPAYTKAYVLDSSYLLEVDLQTGNRVRISGGKAGEDIIGVGPVVEFLFKLTWGPTDSVLYVLDDDRVLAVNIETQERSIVFSEADGVGSGCDLGAFDLAYHRETDRLVIMNQDGVVEIDTTTLQARMVSGQSFANNCGSAGQGPGVSGNSQTPIDFYRRSDGTLAVLVSFPRGQLLGVDLETGDRAYIGPASPLPEGPPFGLTVGMEVDRLGRNAYLGGEFFFQTELTSAGRAVLSR